MIRKLTGISTLLIALAGPVLAAPVVNGTIAGDSYGGAAAAQAVNTEFGDNLNELNAAYCATEGGRLYLALTGNVDLNFDTIEIFIDSRGGGENTISGAPGTNNSINMTGLTFDAGFEPDYLIILRRSFVPPIGSFDLHLCELGTANSASYTGLFGGATTGSGITGVGLNAQPIEVAYDNSNIGGVVAGPGPADPAAVLAVQTGAEISIALSDLGFGAGQLRMCAFINNGDHNFASNQFLGSLTPPQIFLGSDGNGGFTGQVNFDLGDFSGDQYFSCGDRAVTVTPSTWSRIKTNYR